MSIQAYFLGIVVGIDQLLNSVLGGNPDETISSRVGRQAIAGERWALIAEAIIDWIFERLGRAAGHCRRKIEWDEAQGANRA